MGRAENSKSYERCFILSLAIFLGIGKLVQILLPYFNLSVPVLFLIIIAIFLLSFLIALKWAPAETANKPLSMTEKKRQKKLSLVWVTLWFMLISSILLLFSLEKTAFIVLGTIIAHTIQTFSVTPAGFKGMDIVDTLADKLTSKIITERRENYG